MFGTGQAATRDWMNGEDGRRGQGCCAGFCVGFKYEVSGKAWRFEGILTDPVSK